MNGFVMDYFRGILKDRYVLWNLVKNDLKMKYRRSTLGVAWSVLTPLGLVLIIGTVYSIIFGTDPKSLIPALFAGLNPWLFMSGSADGGSMSFIGAEGYIKQTTVSAQIFPFRVTLAAFINLLYSLIAFFVIYLFFQPQLFGTNMLMLFPGLIIMFIFGLSLANISSVINLHYRDYQPLQSLILQGLFYATPIIFQSSMLEEKGFELIYMLNPFYYILEVVKIPMLGQTIPSFQVYAIAVIITLLVFFVSIRMVMKNKKTIAFKL